MNDDRIKILAWLSSLPLERTQTLGQPMSKFLASFERIKHKQFKRMCRLSPCSRKQYARGACMVHYQHMRRISKLVGWWPLVKLKLCYAR